jgi:Fis family transcriptional regulator, factor for inversion stimulation protein
MNDSNPAFANLNNHNAVCLSVHVKQALALYFAQLKGHDTTDLYDLVMREVEKPLLETVLVECGYNQTKAAKMLGLSRSTLRKKLELYGLS